MKLIVVITELSTATGRPFEASIQNEDHVKLAQINYVRENQKKFRVQRYKTSGAPINERKYTYSTFSNALHFAMDHALEIIRQPSTKSDLKY